MRKIIYSVAMSLDGYLAGPNGEADWIIMDPEIDFAGMMSRFDTILMGRRTFEIAGRGGGTSPEMRTVVCSTTLLRSDRRLRKSVPPPKSQISFPDAKLVDTIEVGVMPIALSQGIPLLPAGEPFASTSPWREQGLAKRNCDAQLRHTVRWRLQESEEGHEKAQQENECR